MSLTLTLTGKSSILTVSYFPAIDLSDGAYELGLTDFQTYHTIPNVNSSNNKFYYDTDDKQIEIPEGSYELHDINTYLNLAMIHNVRNADIDNDEKYGHISPLTLRANTNTMKSEIKCEYRINFAQSNTI